MLNPCRSGKKCFETEQEAVDFEQSNREKYDLAKQHAYKCDECPAFHLSALPPGTETMARVDYGNFGHTVGKRRGKQPTPVSAEQEVEIHRLRAEGLSVVKISQRVGIPACRISSLLAEPVNRRGPNKPKTVDTIQQRKANLRAQLEQLEAEEEKVREMNTIRVTVEGAVVVVKKGCETLHLMNGDLATLIEQLMAIATEPTRV